MIVTASSDFNAFKVNKALNRVWRGTSPLALQRQSSRDLSSSEAMTMDMEETLKRIRLDNLLRLTDIKFGGFASALSVETCTQCQSPNERKLVRCCCI